MIYSYLSIMKNRTAARAYSAAETLLRTTQKQMIDTLRTGELPPELVNKLHEQLDNAGFNLALLERAYVDLSWLHSKVFDPDAPDEAQHACSVCVTTAPEMEKVIIALRKWRAPEQEAQQQPNASEVR